MCRCPCRRRRRCRHRCRSRARRGPGPEGDAGPAAAAAARTALGGLGRLVLGRLGVGGYDGQLHNRLPMGGQGSCPVSPGIEGKRCFAFDAPSAQGGWFGPGASAPLLPRDALGRARVRAWRTSIFTLQSSRKTFLVRNAAAEARKPAKRRSKAPWRGRRLIGAPCCHSACCCGTTVALLPCAVLLRIHLRACRRPLLRATCPPRRHHRRFPPPRQPQRRQITPPQLDRRKCRRNPSRSPPLRRHPRQPDPAETLAG